MQFVPIMIVSFAAALGLTPVTRLLARRLDVMDRPSSRKVHSEATPLLGGAAIYGGMIVALALFSFHDYIIELLAILAGASWLAVVGFFDDRDGVAFWKRLGAQALAGFVLTLAGTSIKLTGLVIVDTLLTILWVMAITNAVNFLDNMDGLAAGLTGIASGFFFLLAVAEGQGLVASLAAALCGASIGFLIFNFNPASTFMGDLGATVLGFTLAVLSIKLRFEQPLSIATWAVPLLVLGLPIFDICLVVFTRLRERRPPWQAGKDHTSHRLMQRFGLSFRGVVLVLYGVCLAFGTVALLVSRSAPHQAVWIVAITAGMVLLVFIWLERFRIRQQRAHPTGNL